MFVPIRGRWLVHSDSGSSLDRYRQVIGFEGHRRIDQRSQRKVQTQLEWTLFHQGVDPRERCMVDGSRWKPILEANLCRSAKEVLCLRTWSQDGWSLFRLAIYLVIPFDIHTIASPLSFACASEIFFLITLLTFLHRDKDPLVYACFIYEFHEPCAYGHIFLIIFPTITLLHSIISHWLCSSSFLLYSIYYLFCFTFSPS